MPEEESISLDMRQQLEKEHVGNNSSAKVLFICSHRTPQGIPKTNCHVQKVLSITNGQRRTARNGSLFGAGFVRTTKD